MSFALALLLAASPAVAQDTEAALGERAGAAIKKLEGGDIAGGEADLEPLIRDYQKLYAGEKRQLGCVFMPPYKPTPNGKVPGLHGPNVRMIPNGYCRALWAMGYALADEEKFAEAVSYLQRAVAMAPDYAHYLSELAYVQMRLGRNQEALALYMHAAESAEYESRQEQRDKEAVHALWGAGYVQIELGNLDAAEALFRRCLAIDPDHEKAKSELDYIAQVRAKAGA